MEQELSINPNKVPVRRGLTVWLGIRTNESETTSTKDKRG